MNELNSWFPTNDIFLFCFVLFCLGKVVIELVGGIVFLHKGFGDLQSHLISYLLFLLPQ